MSGVKRSALKALVFGGSGMAGEAICRRLAEDGFDVGVVYFNNDGKAGKIAEELRLSGSESFSLKADLSDVEGVRDAVRGACERLGGLDVLVIASGIASAYVLEGSVELPGMDEITPEIFDRMFSVNVRGVFFACREASKFMNSCGQGKIVILGSINGVKIVHPPIDYACVKAALWGLVRVLAKEFGPKILVNLVAPGVLEGGIAGYLKVEMLDEYLKHDSMKRTGKFSEIANVTAFLVGPKNTYITGQAVVVDGGL